MKKRSVSILLVLCMMLALLPTEALASEESGEPATLPTDTGDIERPEEAEGEDTTIPEISPEPAEDAMLLTDILASGTCGADLTWEIDSNSILTISGTGEMTDYGTADNFPPWTHNSFSAVVVGPGVTSIGNRSFSGNRRVTSVTIPDSVTRIGASAFCDCSSLTSITIPGSVTSMGQGAFSHCSGLTSVTISKGAADIGPAAFSGCSGLTSVTIPDSVTSIGAGAFSGCSGLISITISSSVTSIADYVFQACVELDNVTIPDSVTSLGMGAFANCSSLTSIAIPNSVTTIGEAAFCDCSSLTNIAIPNSVTNIETIAFSRCSGLTSVTIPGSVTSIEEQAFCDCSSLTSVTILDGVTTIEEGAFGLCSNLISVIIPRSVVCIGDWLVDSFSTIYCYKDSYAHQYAVEHSIPYVLLGTSGPPQDPNPDATTPGRPKPPKDITVTVYENKKGNGGQRDRYQLSVGAAVSNNGVVSQTGKNGTYRISDFSNFSDLSVSKDGFAPVFRTKEQLNANSIIHLEPVAPGKPSITAVWLDGADILHTDYSIDLLEENPVTITADVEWDVTTGEGSIKLVQGSKSVTFSGNSVTTVLKDHFDISKTVYIWAGYEKEYAVKEELKLTPNLAYKIDFGEQHKFKIPLWEGASFDAEVGLTPNASIPVIVKVEDGKIYAAIGFQKNKSSNEDAESLSKAAKGAIKAPHPGVSQYQHVRNALKKFGGKLATGKGSFGAEAGFKIMGFAEGYVDNNGNPKWLDSGLIVGAFAEANRKLPFYIAIPVPPYAVPMFFETRLSGEAEAQLNIFVREAAKTFTPVGTFEGAIALSGGAGIGIDKLGSVSGGAEGVLDVYREFLVKDVDYTRLTATLNFYVKAEVLTYQRPFRWKIAEKKWEWPSNASLQSLEMEPYAALYDDLYDPSQYALMSEAEMTDNSVFLANDTVSLFSAENGGMQENIFAANVYSQAKPQLTAFSDGTLLAVWTGLDNRRATYDRPRLYYALCENGIWSNPAPVDVSSSMMEGEPCLAIVNDTAYLAWCRANAPMGTPVDLAEAAARLDIFAGVFDRTNNLWTVSQLTNDQTADFSPIISGGSGGVAVVWQSNSANDLFGQSGATSVSGSQYASGTWTPLLSQYDNVGEISNLAVDMSGSVPRIAWTQEEADGAFAVYLDGVRQSSGSGATFHNGCLYWYQDGHLYQDGQDVGVTLESDRFQIENNTLLYTSGSGLYSTLMAHYYDVSSGRWSDAVALTDGRQSIGSFSAASVGTTVQVLMSSTEVTKEMADIQSDSDDPYGSTNLVLLKDAPVCDLSIGEPWYLEDTYAPGSTMGFHLEVTNNGTVPTNYVVSVSSADGATNTVISQQRLLPGCTEEVTVAYEQGETLSSQLTFTVKALDGSDANSTNDQTALALQYEDIAVEHIGNGVTEDGQYLVYADIVNRGYGVQSGITVSLYQDAVSDSPLQTVIVDSLDSMCSQSVSFQVPTPADQSCYVIAVSHGGADMNAATDSDFTVCTLQESAPIELISVDGNQVELWLDGVPAGTLVVAAYDGNRKMDTVGVVKLTGGETEVCVTMQSTVPEDDSLTAYVLDANTQAPLMKSMNLT